MDGRNSRCDISDKQWEIVSRLLLSQGNRGRKPLGKCVMLNVLMSMLIMWCQWRAMPSDIPNWSSVYAVLWS